ncbi:hypothetical protein [Acetobacterium wieringae]|uniref:hypothetical protein n=1 Tax=Acetobacterium wieringae TaxID=52694 RepID=UPI0020345A85|nr:hypothetical protein [Acetobacterium wieringae]URN84520.1 hypothetical protein CHL1_000083 [Acetobacterium wieringae]
MMIRNLKRRFVATIMIILSLVFALILGSINYFNYQSSERQSISLLSVLADNDGVIPPATPGTPGAANPLPPDIFEREKTYSVKVNAATNLFTINGSSDTSQVSQEVLDLANQMLAKTKFPAPLTVTAIWLLTNPMDNCWFLSINGFPMRWRIGC